MLVYYFLNPSDKSKSQANFDVLENILSQCRLRISRISKANDPTEFKASFGEDVSNEYIEGFRKAMEAANDKFGYISFTDNPYNVLMWSHYAEKHCGIALKFNLPEKWFTRIVYSTEAPRVMPQSREEKGKSGMKYLAEYIRRTKSIDWAYEREQRIIVDYEHPQPGLTIKKDEKDGYYYLYFSANALKAIFIGYKCELGKECLDNKLNENELSHVETWKMEISRNGFELTVNQKSQ